VVRDWLGEMGRAPGRDEALDLWQQAKDAGLAKVRLDDLTERAKARLAELAGPPAPAPAAAAERDWEAEFSAVQDREGAIALWRQARAGGVPEDRLAVLVAVGKAVLVTDRDGAREAYTALVEHVRSGLLSRERLTRLLAVMQARVPSGS
jgi:hypothetical protein